MASTSNTPALRARRLRSDDPCGRLAGLHGRLACLLADLSGGGRRAQPPQPYRRWRRSGPLVCAQPRRAGPYVLWLRAYQVSPSVSASCSVSSAASSFSSASIAASNAWMGRLDRCGERSHVLLAEQHRQLRLVGTQPTRSLLRPDRKARKPQVSRRHPSSKPAGQAHGLDHARPEPM